MRKMNDITCFMFLVLFVSLVFLGCDNSESGGDGLDKQTTTISGTLLDKNGDPVQGAVVTITSTPVSVTTDENGEFSATVEVGEHHISMKVGSKEIYSDDFICDEFPYSFGNVSTQYDPGIDYPDADEDGHNSNEDCDDSNADMNPGITELCNNSIDDDCDGQADCSDSDCNNDAACNEEVSEDIQFTIIKKDFAGGAAIQFFAQFNADVWISQIEVYKPSGALYLSQSPDKKYSSDDEIPFQPPVIGLEILIGEWSFHIVGTIEDGSNSPFDLTETFEISAESPMKQPGDVCETDEECGDDMRCLNSIVIPGKEKYCSPPCSSQQDCSILANNSWSFSLESNIGKNYNIYKTDILRRGIGCYDIVGAPHVGEDKGDGNRYYCFFNCPEYSATAFDENGNLAACIPLPNYKTHSLGTYQGPDYEVGIFEAVWQTEVECSLIKPCPTNNNICEGDNKCVLAENLEGACFSFKSGNLIQDCVRQCNYDCDSDCLGNCYSGTMSSSGLETCVDRCCGSDNPLCN